MSRGIKNIALAAGMGSVLAISGCASLTPTREVVEGYKVYDIPTTYSQSTTTKLADSLKTTMQKNASDVRFIQNLPPQTLSDNPARFALSDPFKGAAGIAGMVAGQFKIPSCDGSVIDATSHDSFAGAENTTFFVCLIPYQAGYRLDVYYSYTKVSGGVDPQALGRALTESVMGDSSKFIPRTISALEGAVASVGLTDKVIDSYPN